MQVHSVHSYLITLNFLPLTIEDYSLMRSSIIVPVMLFSIPFLQSSARTRGSVSHS